MKLRRQDINNIAHYYNSAKVNSASDMTVNTKNSFEFVLADADADYYKELSDFMRMKVDTNDEHCKGVMNGTTFIALVEADILPEDDYYRFKNQTTPFNGAIASFVSDYPEHVKIDWVVMNSMNLGEGYLGISGIQFDLTLLDTEKALDAVLRFIDLFEADGILHKKLYKNWS